MFKPHFIIEKAGSPIPYMRRWFLTPWSRDDHPLKPKRLPNIYLHHIQSSDDDRALHDHPFDNLSIVLRGGYIEHRYAYQPVEGQPLPPVVQVRRKAGSIIYRKADMAHRLELNAGMYIREATALGNADLYFMNKEGLQALNYVEKPCWSIFITWRKRRDWGFWCTKEGVVGVQPLKHNDRVIDLRSYGPVAVWKHWKQFIEHDGCNEVLKPPKPPQGARV